MAERIEKVCPLLTIAGGPRYDGARETSCIAKRCAWWDSSKDYRGYSDCEEGRCAVLAVARNVAFSGKD